MFEKDTDISCTNPRFEVIEGKVYLKLNVTVVGNKITDVLCETHEKKINVTEAIDPVMSDYYMNNLGEIRKN